MRRALGLLVALALLGSLTGCDSARQQVTRLFTKPTPTPIAQPTTGATVAPTKAAPTWTPVPTPTLGMASAITTTVVPTATVEPTKVPLELSCAALWDLYPQGEGLVGTWSSWMAKDPPSPEEHKAKLDEILAGWEKFQAALETIPVADEAQPVVALYGQAIERWVTGVTYASNSIATYNPACGQQVEALEAEATDLWYQAWDQLTKLCSCCASARPTPTATPAPTPAP